ncbi:SIR2 family NAD-dependent protein deacylase [Porphyromonas levii]|uniref:SIR2 family NAD-dependent protein deacylase n=2 Tax=Porphyromonas levii TaxID=28114 RepID=UPI001B8CC548|nr:NAD-dependent deacylase [Porphyromonas levii]MBR8703791.1 NAD-dependent protein deacylase [Porphyromonas levii]MBR8729764.1 NAD-dependent protein deacylase [Porphyromonas levii]MBR8732043.1 NAD-dependent protein deacylase [Porphyromonas levii]MBR8760183.1 NAD-dependent protein deacylase [Porphyromonas levii]MBR8764360.1 NAD-dependent protein deacylase [Porphyromonas levii]
MKRKKIVALTGAGISAESGIATFRDSDGLWERYSVEEVASADGYRRNPQLVIDFANDRREQCLKAQPNEGHLLLAKLEEDYDVTVITQNIDDLHERAGSSHIIHLHGELMKCCSERDLSTPLPLPEGRLRMTLEDKAEDGSQLRPFIVYFGEPVPRMEDAIAEAEQADIFLIVGTSLNVYPAAGLVRFVPRSTPVFIIDPKEVPGSNQFEHIRMGAGKGMAELMKRLRNEQQ